MEPNQSDIRIFMLDDTKCVPILVALGVPPEAVTNILIQIRVRNYCSETFALLTINIFCGTGRLNVGLLILYYGKDSIFFSSIILIIGGSSSAQLVQECRQSYFMMLLM
jgi:hypothetical protein